MAVAFTVVVAAEAAAQEKARPRPLYEGLYVESDPEFETGKYGTKFRSSYLTVPVTIGYDRDGFIGDVEVPWIWQRTHGNTVLIAGRPTRVSKSGSAKFTTESGLGDVVAGAGYALFEKHDGLPSLVLRGEVKIPTADDERGLGTGSYDETFLVSSGINFLDSFKASVKAGYSHIGQPEDIPSGVTEYRDIALYGAGLAYAFNRDNEAWLRFEGSTAVVAHTPTFALLSFEFDHWFPDSSQVFASLGFGLTKASPGLALELGYRFLF